MNRLFYKIKRDLNISRIVMENDGTDFFMGEFLNTMNNSNMCMILIENMCLSLILPDYIALQFEYIRLLHEKNEIEYYKNFHVKIFRLNCQWDNRKWSYCKLKMFHTHIGQIENKTITEIENILSESQWLQQYIDIEFLKALSWGRDE